MDYDILVIDDKGSDIRTDGLGGIFKPRVEKHSMKG